MTEIQKRKVALEVLKSEAEKVGIQLTTQDEANIIANGISSLEQLKGIHPYVKPTVFGGNVFHDADGVVESTGRRR